MRRNRKIYAAQKTYHDICEASWKRYESNEITYQEHEETAKTAMEVYMRAINHKKNGGQK